VPVGTGPDGHWEVVACRLGQRGFDFCWRERRSHNLAGP